MIWVKRPLKKDAAFVENSKRDSSKTGIPFQAVQFVRRMPFVFLASFDDSLCLFC